MITTATKLYMERVDVCFYNVCINSYKVIKRSLNVFKKKLFLKRVFLLFRVQTRNKLYL